jgi:hypothetical protein
VTVSLGGTALREMVTGKGSEGHFFGFAASLILNRKHLLNQRPKRLERNDPRFIND